MNKKGIILLSGGLDSFISCNMAKKQCDIVLALNFNYGQKPYREEREAAKNIADYYNIKLETIDLPYLKKEVGDLDDFESVWVPNRNGVFLNIAAAYCDKYNIDYIIFGANIDEAKDFKDNSEEFIKKTNEVFKYSTLKHPEIIAPCSKLKKVDMINYAIDNNLPLNLIKSCYDNSEKKHCGKCMSCKLLYQAIINSKKPDLIKELF